MNVEANSLSLPSEIVTDLISRREDVSIEDLPPLYSVIDPDVIDALPRPATLAFPYCGYDVVVHGEGTVVVEDR